MEAHLVPAAQYVRMSTEHQRYSITNQNTAIAAYAEERGYRIVASFTDAGISGLDLKRRPGLRALLEAVMSSEREFRAILVLDVSRWGRFQDIDESAFYEYMCRRAGVNVEYCGEPFDNDLTPYSSLVKAMKRIMAAEYSRELSARCWAGSTRLAAAGFKQGGPPPIGLRRLLVDAKGQPKQILEPGQQKSLASDRVILVPGPDEETRLVNEIFRAFLNGESAESIARRQRDAHALGRRWNPTTIRSMLEHPAYGGQYVYNRSASRLAGRHKTLKRGEWTFGPCTIPRIVPAETFNAVQQLIANKYTVRQSDEHLLKRLKDHVRRWGRITCVEIDSSRQLPSHRAYIQRFGSLNAAYQRIGYESDCCGRKRRKQLADLRSQLWREFEAVWRLRHVTLSLTAKKYRLVSPPPFPALPLVLAAPKWTPALGDSFHIRLQGQLWRHPLVVAILSRDCCEVREYLVCSPLTPKTKWTTVIDRGELNEHCILRFSNPHEFPVALRGMKRKLQMATLSAQGHLSGRRD